MDVDGLLSELAPRLAGALIATDFDGTLAPLVPNPQDSRPVTGSIDALAALSGRGARVAVITGRDARTVVRLGGLDAVPGLTVAGLYGLESWSDGSFHSPDEPDEIAALRERLPGLIAHGDERIWIEDKRLSLVVHARRADDPDAALAEVRDAVQREADRLGLEVHPGAQVLELRLPGYDKAGALARLAEGAGAVLFLGDDIGDVPAFDEIRRLRASGVYARSVGVLSSGADGVAGAVDLTVPDPPAAADLLARLAASR